MFFIHSTVSLNITEGPQQGALIYSGKAACRRGLGVCVDIDGQQGGKSTSSQEGPASEKLQVQTCMSTNKDQ